MMFDGGGDGEIVNDGRFDKMVMIQAVDSPIKICVCDWQNQDSRFIVALKDIPRAVMWTKKYCDVLRTVIQKGDICNMKMDTDFGKRSEDTKVVLLKKENESVGKRFLSELRSLGLNPPSTTVPTPPAGNRMTPLPSHVQDPSVPRALSTPSYDHNLPYTSQHMDTGRASLNWRHAPSAFIPVAMPLAMPLAMPPQPLPRHFAPDDDYDLPTSLPPSLSGLPASLPPSVSSARRARRGQTPVASPYKPPQTHQRPHQLHDVSQYSIESIHSHLSDEALEQQLQPTSADIDLRSFQFPVRNGVPETAAVPAVAVPSRRRIGPMGAINRPTTTAVVSPLKRDGDASIWPPKQALGHYPYDRCTIADPNTWKTLKMSYQVTPSQFYVRDEEMMHDMEDAMKEFVDSVKMVTPGDIELHGHYLLVASSRKDDDTTEKKLYRVRVLSLGENKIVARFLDIGHEQAKITNTVVAYMPTKLGGWCELAQRCYLKDAAPDFGADWSSDAKHEFGTNKHKLFTVKIDGQSYDSMRGYAVELWQDNVDVLGRLVHKRVARKSQSDNAATVNPLQPPQDPPQTRMPVFKGRFRSQDLYKGYILTSDTVTFYQDKRSPPEQFVLIFGNPAIQDIERILERYNRMDVVDTPVFDDTNVCAVARETREGKWLRAEFVKQHHDPHKIVVDFVDIGRQEAVNSRFVLPVVLDKVVNDTPKAALPCTLFGAHSSDLKQLPIRPLNWLIRALKFKVTLLDWENGRMQAQVVLEDGANLAKLLNDEILSAPSSELHSEQGDISIFSPSSAIGVAAAAAAEDCEPGTRGPVVVSNHLPSLIIPGNVDDFIDGLVSYVDVDDFCVWLQLCNEAETVEAVQKKATLCAQTASNRSNIQTGELCIAKFSVDGNWYRARVVKRTDIKTYTVHFIDFGNSEEVDRNDMKMMSQGLYEAPAQAFRLYFKDITEPKNWQDFVAVIPNREITFKILGKREDGYVGEAWIVGGERMYNLNRVLIDKYPMPAPEMLIVQRTKPKPSHGMQKMGPAPATSSAPLVTGGFKTGGFGGGSTATGTTTGGFDGGFSGSTSTAAANTGFGNGGFGGGGFNSGGFGQEPGNRRSGPGGVCYNCNQPGHISRECPQPRKPRTDNQTASAGFGGFSSAGSAFGVAPSGSGGFETESKPSEAEPLFTAIKPVNANDSDDEMEQTPKVTPNAGTPLKDKIYEKLGRKRVSDGGDQTDSPSASAQASAQASVENLQPAVEPKATQQKVFKFPEQPDLEEGEKFDVFYVYSSNPHNFYVLPEKPEWPGFQKQLSADVKIEQPAVGQACVAQYLGDCYRAEVKEINEGSIKVYFVDFGNEESVQEVYEIDADSASLFPHAVRTKLKGVHGWDKDALWSSEQQQIVDKFGRLKMEVTSVHETYYKVILKQGKELVKDIIGEHKPAKAEAASKATKEAEQDKKDEETKKFGDLPPAVFTNGQAYEHQQMQEAIQASLEQQEFDPELVSKVELDSLNDDLERFQTERLRELSGDTVQQDVQNTATVLKYAAQPQLEEGEEMEVFSIYSTSPQNFYVVPQKDGWPSFQTLLHASVKIEKPVVGQACVAQYVGECYRAQVKHVKPGGIDVYFVDFGNEETVDAVYEIDADSVAIFPLAIRTKLKGTHRWAKDAVWSPEQQAKADALKMLKMEVKSVHSTYYKVVLTEGDMPVKDMLCPRSADEDQIADDETSEMMDASRNDQPQTAPISSPALAQLKVLPEQPKLEVGGKVSGFVSIVNEGVLWMQPEGWPLPQFEADCQLMHMMQPRVGQYCIAEYCAAYYRAKIIDINEGKSRVDFVDYGNVEEVDEVFELPDSMYALHAAAIAVVLDAVHCSYDLWSDKQKEVVNKLVDERVTVVVTKFEEGKYFGEMCNELGDSINQMWKDSEEVEIDWGVGTDEKEEVVGQEDPVGWE